MQNKTGNSERKFSLKLIGVAHQFFFFLNQILSCNNASSYLDLLLVVFMDLERRWIKVLNKHHLQLWNIIRHKMISNTAKTAESIMLF